MSDGGRQPREWRLYIKDMIRFGEKVLSYTEGLDEKTLFSDDVRYDAVLRNLELIGEAATHVPVRVREAHPDVPWRAIIGIRNRLAHGYMGISDRVIWTTVQNAVPQLLPPLRELLNAAVRNDRPE